MQHGACHHPLVCKCNWLGMLVIGKATTLHFKGVKTLPVDHDAKKKSLRTREIIVDWVRVLDHKFSPQKRKVLLSLKNCTLHDDLKDLKAIHLAFLPKDRTSVLQPVDLAITKDLKTLCMRDLLQRELLC